MIKKELFGILPDGREVYAYTLSNGSIVSARIINYGGSVVNLWVKDKNGKVADVICGYDNLADYYSGYLNNGGFQGAIIGRVSNRISKARFTIDGVEYKLFESERGNCNHGGDVGFNKRFWEAVEYDSETEPALVLSYLSPDMEENFPGNLKVEATYSLTKDGGLSINFKAVTDKKTIVNLTNHNYYNLSGYECGTIADHIVWIDADTINELDNDFIPTGKFAPVEGTLFDFRTPKEIGKAFNDPSLAFQEGGYDNCFIINDSDEKTIKKAASVFDPKSGRRMDMYTNQPCVLLYTSNWLSEKETPFKGGVKQRKHCALCLETQKMPDSINHPGFTNTVLNPGEVYDYTSIFKFSND